MSFWVRAILYTFIRFLYTLIRSQTLLYDPKLNIYILFKPIATSSNALACLLNVFKLFIRLRYVFLNYLLDYAKNE